MDEFFVGDVNELLQKLAYEFWEQRGRPVGSPEVDWQKAEESSGLYGLDSQVGPPLSAFSMGPNE